MDLLITAQHLQCRTAYWVKRYQQDRQLCERLTFRKLARYISLN